MVARRCRLRALLVMILSRRVRLFCRTNGVAAIWRLKGTKDCSEARVRGRRAPQCEFASSTRDDKTRVLVFAYSLSLLGATVAAAHRLVCDV